MQAWADLICDQFLDPVKCKNPEHCCFFCLDQGLFMVNKRSIWKHCKQYPNKAILVWCQGYPDLVNTVAQEWSLDVQYVIRSVLSKIVTKVLLEIMILLQQPPYVSTYHHVIHNAQTGCHWVFHSPLDSYSSFEIIVLYSICENGIAAAWQYISIKSYSWISVCDLWSQGICGTFYYIVAVPSPIHE